LVVVTTVVFAAVVAFATGAAIAAWLPTSAATTNSGVRIFMATLLELGVTRMRVSGPVWTYPAQAVVNRK
jgi:hypothetical protein